MLHKLVVGSLTAFIDLRLESCVVLLALVEDTDLIDWHSLVGLLRCGLGEQLLGRVQMSQRLSSGFERVLLLLRRVPPRAAAASLERLHHWHLLWLLGGHDHHGRRRLLRLSPLMTDHRNTLLHARLERAHPVSKLLV